MEAARRATQTKWEIVNFKKKPPAGQHKQKKEIVFFQQKKTPAGQHTQSGKSCIKAVI